MAEKTLNFNRLSDCVINQLKKQNYMDSTLMVYRRIYNRIHSLMKKLGTETYTPEIGRQLLVRIPVRYGGLMIISMTFLTDVIMEASWKKSLKIFQIY